MYSMECRSAAVLLLALGAFAQPVIAEESVGAVVGAAIGTLFSGETMQVAQAEAAQPAAAAAPAAPVVESVPSLSLPGSSGALFGGDASTSSAQRSATAGYELSGSGIGSSANPHQSTILTSGTKGRAIRFSNGIFVYPAVTAGVGYNDNVAGTPTNAKGSTVYVLRPEVVAEIKRRGDRYTAGYSGNYGKYSSSSADDFDNHDFWVAGDNYFTTRARLGWGLGYQMRSDARGSTDRIASNEPDRWRAPVARVIGIYGAPKAKGRLELEGSWMQKRYQNNRAYTEASDVDLSTVSGRFFFRFMPKTSVLFEARNTWADYKQAISTQDNTDRRLYAGLVWEATAKTTGTLKLGRAYKNFDSNTRQDGNSNSWEAEIAWSPLTYSKVELAASRSPSDSTGVGNYMINNGTNLAWTHKWASFVTSNIFAGHIKSDYEGSNRSDKTKSYGIGFYRELSYNFRLGASWSRTNRDSTDPAAEFKRNVSMLTLEGIL